MHNKLKISPDDASNHGVKILRCSQLVNNNIY